MISLDLSDLIDMAKRNGGGKDATQTIPIDVYAQRLRDHFNDLSKAHDLKEGDLVKCKPGFCTIPPMENGYPAIVTKILPSPLQYENTGCKHDGTFFDVILMVIHEDTCVEFTWDSRKLEPYTGPKVFGAASPAPAGEAKTEAEAIAA